MKAKARSLSAPQERKSKVVLNCIIRAVHYKGRGFICGIFQPRGWKRCVSISAVTTGITRGLIIKHPCGKGE